MRSTALETHAIDHPAAMKIAEMTQSAATAIPDMAQGDQWPTA